MNKTSESSWEGVENDSPKQLLVRFHKRFPTANLEDFHNFSVAVGLGYSAVREYCRENKIQ